MKRALIAVLATMVLAGTAPAADKPNFSGEWSMNAAKSDFGQLPAPTSFVRINQIPIRVRSHAGTWLAQVAESIAPSGAPRFSASGSALPLSVNDRDTELRQCRSPVGRGPSGNTWPRWLPQRAQTSSTRSMP
jgi:hypothetical protein